MIERPVAEVRAEALALRGGRPAAGWFGNARLRRERELSRQVIDDRRRDRAPVGDEGPGCSQRAEVDRGAQPMQVALRAQDQLAAIAADVDRTGVRCENPFSVG